MPNINLVTGGAGFIGSHLCNELLKSGNQVICLDNLSTGSEKNIQSFLGNKNFKFIKGRVNDLNIISKVSQLDINKIYHLASPASVTYITAHPVDAAIANSIGTKNLLDLALKKRAKFLFASSSEVYGDSQRHPQKETYWGNVNPIGVRSGYDEGKRFGEALSIGYARQYKVKVKIVRIFNTYGPNSSPQDSRVIPSFIVNALQNKLLPIHGDGRQTRSFCYVSDMVDGFIKMMESNETGPINLGNPDEYRIINVAKKIINKINSNSRIEFVELPKDDPKVRRPDISLAKEKLNWTPRVPFEEGLAKTIQYFKKFDL